MNRHQRRKRALERKDANAALLLNRAMHVLATETAKRALATKRAPMSPKGLGNRGIYQAIGMYPAPGYSSGAFKEKPMGERALREQRSQNR